MKTKTCSRLNRYLLVLVFFCTPIQAFSPSPENNEEYTPADWANSDSAENDAKIAITHNDLRLLGFAGKGFNIPGIDSAQSQNYRDKCGVRYFKEFGDVIRNRDQLEQMKKAKEYAVEYNRVILNSCTLSN
ncbi:MAG: hypothetical protein GQ550_01550 [Gammaproteobacteria bacterium]|nr:hypothetical protein [Gammaproteobacteria bacterium]